MQKWIVFDVDDVICNFRESLFQSFKKLGHDVHWSTWSSYRHTEIYPIKDEKDFHLHMVNHCVLENALIEENVKELFSQLKKDGYCIGLLTARAWHDNGYDITQKFIEKNNLPVDKLVISGQHMDKKSNHIGVFEGQIVAYIDDSIHHVEDFLAHNVPAFLMDRPWNQQAQDLPRVSSLNDFQKQIKHLDQKTKIKITI